MQLLGKLAPRTDPRTLMLSAYVDKAALPEIPDTIDWGTGVHTFPLYGNSELGDCTCAAAGHMVQIWTATTAIEKTLSTKAVETLYWSTGFDDNGRACIDVLNYWRREGIAGQDAISAWVKVDHRNPAELHTALYLFGGLYIGVAMPRTADQQKVWDVDRAAGEAAMPGSWGGHCINLHAHDEDGWGFISWGKRMRMTEAFFGEYVDETYAILSPDWINAAGTSQAGVSFDDLRADLRRVAA